MFIVNQEILSEKNNKPLWDWYQKKIKEIKGSGKKFYQYNTLPKPIFLTTDKGNLKSKKFKILPLVSVFENKDFDEFQTWEYAASANAIKMEHGYPKIQRRGFFFQNETILSVDKDIEIIFFLNVLSNYLEKGALYLIDRDKENKQRAEKLALESEVQYLITSPSSPISPERMGSDDVFKQMCIAWGVTDVREKPIYQLKNELKDAVFFSQVNFSQTQRGYELFIKECNSLGDSELRSEVMLAIEKELLTYDGLTWKLKGKGGTEQAVEIMEQKDRPQAPDILVRRFSNNNTLKNLLQEIIKDDASTPVVQNMTQWELREKLKDVGLAHKDLIKMKVPELKQLYQEKVLSKV